MTNMNSNNSKRKVRFGGITIRDYPIVLGDNPNCSPGGPPISLGWEYTHEVVKSNVQLYDIMKQDQRRDRKEMQLTASERYQILQRVGYSDEEIASAIKAVNKTQKERQDTIAKQEVGVITSIAISTGKLPKGLLRGLLATTGGTIKLAQSIPKGIYDTTGRLLRAKSQSKISHAMGA